MFRRGQETGHEADSASVSKEMDYAQNLDGTRKFKFEEFLSNKQISSYFSRMVAKIKKGLNLDDVTADNDQNAALG